MIPDKAINLESRDNPTEIEDTTKIQQKLKLAR